MSITRSSIQRHAVRLLISPPPTTLGESTAVLKKLQSFGQVTSFTKDTPRATRPASVAEAAEQQEVNVIFASEEAIERAHGASPFTVKVNHDLPDPKVEDPYNVRNLQSRKQPKPMTMTCHLELEGAVSPSGQNVFSTGFSPSVQTRLYQSLMHYTPPTGIAAALGVFHTDTSDLSSTAELVDPAPDLMEMYRSQPSGRDTDSVPSESSEGVNYVPLNQRS